MSRDPEQLDLLDWLAAQGAGPARSETGNTEPSPEPKALGAAPLLLTRVDPACNMRRFYSVALAVSLWGECGVIRHWGRIGNQGQRRTDWYEEAQDAEHALNILLRAKRRRGYQP